MKAFRGPNGWYVAHEDETGTHYQPRDGGRYESKEAALAAAEREHEAAAAWCSDASAKAAEDFHRWATERARTGGDGHEAV